MTLVRLEVRFEHFDALVDHVNDHHVAVSIIDADTIVTLGSLHERLTSPLGVWLELSPDYCAPIAARDVATLSWLVPIDTVIVAGERAEASAEVVEALFTNDEVNFTNDVATLVGAYNRPAPPSPITVWSFDGTILRHGDERLREASCDAHEHFELTTFR
jgi:hypothetical protein